MLFSHLIKSRLSTFSGRDKAQKMHDALWKVGIDGGKKFIGGVKDSPSKNFQESISKENLEVSEDLYPARKSDSRCAFLAFLTLESNSTWRIITLPLHYLDRINFASGVNMDGLRLVLPPPIHAFKVDHQKDQHRFPPEKDFSVNTYTGRSITGSYVRRHPRYRSRLSTLKERSGKSSSQSLETCNNLSLMNLDGFTHVDRSDTSLYSSKTDKTATKSLKRKTKKKSQQSEKFSFDAGSTDPETRLQEYGHWSSTSEARRDNDVDDQNGLVFCSLESGLLSCDGKLPQEENEDNNKGSEIVNISEGPSSVSSYADKVNPSENNVREALNSTVKDDICNSEILLQDPLVLDSIPIGTKSNQSNSDHYAKQSQKPSSSNSTCPHGLDTRGDHSMCQTSIHGNGNPCDLTGVKHAVQSCSNSEKKGKQKKSIHKSSIANNFEFSGNSHGRVGKENNHSVWKKVQRSVMDECGEKVKKASSTLSQTHISARKAPSHKRNCNLVDVNSEAEEKKQSKHTVGRKLKIKNNAAPKQELNCYSRRGSHSSRAIIDEPGEFSKQQSAIFYSSPENNQIRYSALSRSHAHIDSQRDGCQITRAGSKNSESVEHQQIYPNDLLLVKDNASVSIIENQRNLDNEENLFPNSCNYINKSNSSEQSMHLSYVIADGPGDVQKEAAVADCNKLNHSSSSTMQKWVPRRVKDSGSSIPIHSECAAAFSAKSSTLMNSLLGKSDNENVVSSFSNKATHLGQTSRNSTVLPRHEHSHLKSWNQDYFGQVQGSNQASGSCLPSEYTHHDMYEIDSCRIAQAVSEACNVQLASEAIHTVSGGPIAEFERLLHVCSPVICQSTDLVKCLTCADSNTLCRHESTLSLGNIWQWYEKHGSYGLEIRGQDHENPKRVGADRFSFRAYFVPFLSAVQLFRCSNNQTVHSSAKTPDIEHLGGSRIVYNSEGSSNDCQNPIFSVLFPRPGCQDQSNPVFLDQMSCSDESLNSSKHISSIQSSKTTCSDELELLFEYFETQPPQQRRPLYSKILELIRGRRISESQMYGDPTNLDAINMEDLHPKSWYSVAWYPIYRIPDSSFRAAFLTYHSLGNLVPQSSNMDFQDTDACVVSPVVGLQSYNAQGECWFQMKQTAPSETMRTSGLNPSEILRERLRTLEETASLMSKAVVNKGNRMSTNKHHDYEFFLSRRS